MRDLQNPLVIKKKTTNQQNVRSGQSLCMHSLLNLIDNLHDEMEMFHIWIGFKTIDFKFYSGNKSLLCHGQYIYFPSQKNVVNVIISITISITLRRWV